MGLVAECPSLEKPQRQADSTSCLSRPALNQRDADRGLSENPGLVLGFSLSEVARMPEPVQPIELDHYAVEEGERCKALWFGVLTYLVSDAMAYRAGRKVYGATPVELAEAYQDVMTAGPMTSYVCGLLDIPPAYVQRLVRQGLSGRDDVA